MSKHCLHEYNSHGLITAECDPLTEFEVWEQSADWNPDDWKGDEFTLQDFVDYINYLKSKDTQPLN
jgi:hypothetical protein